MTGTGRSDVSIAELVAAGLLRPGDTLYHTKGTATITVGARIKVGDSEYVSPTTSASELSGTHVNGWVSWRLGPEKRAAKLSSLRDEYRQRSRGDAAPR
jgi:hypothetical protein